VSGKIEFGVDYLTIMRFLQSKGHPNGFDPVDDAAAKLFLLQWGFSVEEIDAANAEYVQRLNNQTLGNDIFPIAKRLSDHIKGDEESKDRLVIELAAIGLMDANVTNDEDMFVSAFQNLLDMKPSHFQALTKVGNDWAIALNYFGTEFAKSRGATLQ
jgi:hypothetical protein